MMDLRRVIAVGAHHAMPGYETCKGFGRLGAAA
jgi:hypothetical protein